MGNMEQAYWPIAVKAAVATFFMNWDDNAIQCYQHACSTFCLGLYKLHLTSCQAELLSLTSAPLDVKNITTWL